MTKRTAGTDQTAASTTATPKEQSPPASPVKYKILRGFSLGGFGEVTVKMETLPEKALQQITADQLPALIEQKYLQKVE